MAEPDRDLFLDLPAQGATPNDFNDLDEVKERLAGFERLYNEIAEPFAWNFTREKLNSWLARLGKNTYSYIIKGFPRRVIWKHSLSAVELAAAQDACRRAHVTNAALLGGCTVDVGATGDRQLAASAGAYQREAGLQPTPASGRLSGLWSGMYSGAYQGTFILNWKQSGSSLSGKIKLSSPGVTLGIRGKVSGDNSIQFGAVGFVTYSGSVSGNSMSGTYRSPRRGGTWSATKIS